MTSEKSFENQTTMIFVPSLGPDAVEYINMTHRMAFVLESTQIMDGQKFIDDHTKKVCDYCVATKPEKRERNDCATCPVVRIFIRPDGRRKIIQSFDKPHDPLHVIVHANRGIGPRAVELLPPPPKLTFWQKLKRCFGND